MFNNLIIILNYHNKQHVMCIRFILNFVLVKTCPVYIKLTAMLFSTVEKQRNLTTERNMSLQFFNFKIKII